MFADLGLAGVTWNRFRNSYKVNAVKSEVLRMLFPILWAHRRAGLARKLHTRSPVWIHFGCGTIADRRFVNVDARPFAHVDYLTTSSLMPAIPNGSSDLIYACHVFEHVSHHRVQLRTLSRWREMLKPGGALILSVPDFEKVAAQFGSGDRSFESMQSALMGGQEYKGNFHYALFTAGHLRALLERAGFENIRSWRPDENENWPRDWSWDSSVSLNLRAEKPAS